MRARSATAIGAIVGVVALGLTSVPARAAVSLKPKLSGSVSSAALARRGGKLSPRLSVLESTPSFAAAQRRRRRCSALPASGPGSLVQEPGGRVLVEIRTSSTSASAVAKLRTLGAQIVNVSATYSTVTASVAPSALGAIAQDSDVTYVNEVLAPITSDITRHTAGTFKSAASGCAPTVSEGDSLMNVAAARAAKNVDGTGQTIGVLSDSFNTAPGVPTHAAADIATGDLPGPGNPCGYTTPVTVQADYNGGQQTDEGRAMVELAHGLAPRLTSRSRPPPTARSTSRIRSRSSAR